jgi:hypothetical protein
MYVPFGNSKTGRKAGGKIGNTVKIIHEGSVFVE